MTAFVFNRPLTARCHFEDVSLSLTTSQWVIFAYGESNEFTFHGTNRGMKQLFLTPPKVEFENQLPGDVETVEVRGPRVVVPRNETTMWVRASVFFSVNNV